MSNDWESMTVTISFDGSSYSGYFMSPASARRWIIETLDALLEQNGLLKSSQIQIQRTS